MESPLEYRVVEKENALYLCLKGDLDEQSFLTISRALSDRKLVQPIKVDLGGVRYADSTGLRALVLLQRQAQDAGVHFTLLEPSEAVKRVFRSTGLSVIFDIGARDPEGPC